MKIISYNVNGLRAAIKKGFLEWLEKENPDIICLQETKMQEDQLDKLAFEALGYHQYWNMAEKKGYSGVGILTKIKPDHFSKGMGIPEYDREGRVIRLDFNGFTLINSYFPSGSSGDDRQAFKMQYLADMQIFIDHLKKDRPDIVLCGDYNICHKAKDINHPERHKNSSGFLPEERAWMDRFVGSGFIDSFREFDSGSGKYSWWSYRANSRAKNLGWRIDYHMITENLRPKLLNAGILPDVSHSDHCPVWVELEGEG
ncbi:MAG: exodeoxyribonuclease III [Bacteroidales bacterium]|nr:exodeoxyribonuclease III [Bacteroidales bacterium]MCF8405945.1 exodeoxyribonuclease III [Bacteroidales bacterium]